MAKTEIRISGLGGQGVILSGYIIGRAASIFDTKYATMTQSFGPEARGSACSCQVILSADKILYPYIRQPDIMVAMSQEAYEKFSPQLSSNGILLIDSDLVKVEKARDNITLFGIPATRFAEELGRKIVLNIIMIGFFTSITGIVTKEAVEKAILRSIPKGTEELNMRAFEKGYDYGIEYLKKARTEKKKTGTRKKAVKAGRAKAGS
jgi:2-oxoglutarate ferredoxin oxidoreductase subunit gamma